MKKNSGFLRQRYSMNRCICFALSLTATNCKKKKKSDSIAFYLSKWMFPHQISLLRILQAMQVVHDVAFSRKVKEKYFLPVSLFFFWDNRFLFFFFFWGGVWLCGESPPPFSIVAVTVQQCSKVVMVVVYHCEKGDETRHCWRPLVAAESTFCLPSQQQQ